MEERDIIKTTWTSRIAVFNEEQGEIETMKANGQNSDLISYTVRRNCAISF